MTGSGTQGDPYIVWDVDDLQLVGDQVTYLLSAYYELGANIDASETETWNTNNGFLCIGLSLADFTGSFDGKEYTISDIWMRRSTANNIGLFSATDGATIQNVTMTGATVWGNDDVGVLVGDARNSTITDCHTSGTVKGVVPNDALRHGGLIGYIYNSTITNCSSSCTVLAVNYVGGLVGRAWQATISQCYATGNATADDYNLTGDPAGYVGGLLGVSQQNDIDDCYARGDVDGDGYIGGLIGYAYDNTETIDNCFSTGAVTGNTDVGGLLGYSESVVSDCFWDTVTSGQASSADGTGKTTTQMKVISTFTAASWNIAGSNTNRNDGYPFLAWEIDETDTIWKIYGVGKRSFTMPDILDQKGRPIKNARVEAYRMDTHAWVETEYTDDNGSATFDDLPSDVDVIFTPTWGGPRTPRQPIIQG